jgi:predicted GTPase
VSVQCHGCYGKWQDHGQAKFFVCILGLDKSELQFINLVSGSNLRVGRGLKSCTNIVQMAMPFEIDGRSITLIDTPGFDDTTRSDTDILKMIAGFLQTS